MSSANEAANAVNSTAHALDERVAYSAEQGLFGVAGPGRAKPRCCRACQYQRCAAAASHRSHEPRRYDRDGGVQSRVEGAIVVIGHQSL